MQTKNVLILIFLFLAIAAGIFYFYAIKGSPIEQSGAPKTISVLISSDLQLSAIDGLKMGLKELGYEDGKNVIFKVNNPKGDRELTVKMAKEIVASKPDLIVSLSTSATSGISDANKEAKIPVIFADVGNFQQLGIVDIRKPGGFMTGVVVDNVPGAPKRMELLRILVPDMKTVGILVNPKHVSYDEIVKSYGSGAEKLGVKILWYPVSTKEDVRLAMAKLVKDKPDGFMTTSEAVISNNPDLIAPALKSAKIPSIDFNMEVGVKSGYLMVQGTNRFDTGKQSARLVVKALKGENPGDIPVEFSSILSFEINEALAKEMGITIPEQLLLQATKVYKQ